MQKEYLNQDQYCEFLKKIKGIVGKEKIGLFYDGLAVHKTDKAKNLLNRYGWVKLQNEAWQSTLNPIETFFSFIKRHFYKQMLHIGANPNVVKGKNMNELYIEDMVTKSIEEYRYTDMSRQIDSCSLKVHQRLKQHGLKNTLY